MVLPPLIFAGLAVMFLFGMNRDDPRALRSTREGQTAPALTITPLGAGEAFTQEALQNGQVKLVNFWASWCTPCRIEHPQLEAMAQEGIDIYGINYKDDPAKALGFLERLGNPYASLGADPDGRTALDWGVYGVPETFVIDGNGIVMLRFAGPITESILESKIRPAMEAAALSE
ncbi:MAG: DsbE family thiol:disulfide interchange protein [Rhodobacteraceae bacterium]|nr:DsbE family thiol:disulfide interchange protein [Paracoccaceae bacterium]